MEKVKRFLLRFKWWFVAAAVGISALLFRPSDPVRRGLVDYYNKSGSTLDVSVLSHHLVSDRMADSLEIILITDNFDKYPNRYAVFDAVKKINNRNHLGAKTFTEARYIIRRSGKECFTDTMSAILNDSLRVVWEK